jgi:hypothetical protein
MVSMIGPACSYTAQVDKASTATVQIAGVFATTNR